LATQDEIVTERDAWLCEPKSAAEIPVFRSGPEVPAERCPHPVLVSNGVGGGTLHYAGSSPPLAPWNFRARSETVPRYGAAAIPADSTLIDWPLDYEELEPFYDQVERAIGVSGMGGQHQGNTGPRWQSLRRRAPPRLPDAPTAPEWMDAVDVVGGIASGLASVPNARRDFKLYVHESPSHLGRLPILLVRPTTLSVLVR
jgi:choline dehydrogenase-like flavoprotein